MWRHIKRLFSTEEQLRERFDAVLAKVPDVPDLYDAERRDREGGNPEPPSGRAKREEV